MTHPFRSSAAVVPLIGVLLCCSPRTAVLSNRAPTATDSSFFDLKPGGLLKIVVPLKAGGAGLMPVPNAGKEGSLVFSAPDLTGYESSYYSVVGRSDGTVRIRFRSAETVQSGKSTPTGENTLKLPFALPTKRAHVRLVYLVRQSGSDHNMAIAGAKELAVLNSFTQNLKTDPSLCKVEGEIFCSWVPAGVAVRPE